MDARGESDGIGLAQTKVQVAAAGGGCVAAVESTLKLLENEKESGNVQVVTDASKKKCGG